MTTKLSAPIRLLSAPLATCVLSCLVIAADRGEIQSGETRAGLQIVAPGYMDTWTFQGIAGDRVLVRAQETSGLLTPWVKLYPPGGGPVQAEDFRYVDHQLTQSGEYTIVVEDFGHNHEGTYNITFLKLPGDLSSPQDPDRGPIASGQTLASGLAIDAASDMDAFHFYGQAGDRALITAPDTSGSLTTWVKLFPPRGGPVEAEEFRHVDHRLTQSGVYTIVVEDFGGNHQGAYDITLLKLPGAVSHPDDPDGGTIVSGQTLVPGGIIGVASDMDGFHFYGQAGDRALVTIQKTAGALTPWVKLYPPDGAPVEAESFGQVDHHLARTGLYTVVVEDFLWLHVGTYNVSFTKIPADQDPGLYHPCPPTGGSLGDCCFAMLEWEPVPGAFGYDVYFGTNVLQPLQQIADGIDSPPAALPTLQHEQLYYWQVIAHTQNRDVFGPWWWFVADLSLAPNISMSPATVDFETTCVGAHPEQQTLTVANDGTARLCLETISITSDTSHFQLVADNCSSGHLQPGEYCTVHVSFAPTFPGFKSAFLRIPSNDPGTPVVFVPISGTATPCYVLTASVVGGHGTISPTGGTYPAGEVVQLMADPDPGSRVRAWNGTDDDTSTGTTNTVTMDGDRTVTVEFEPMGDGTGPDCNNNGIDDALDILTGASEDCNDNNVPDECEPDGDGDGVIDDCDSCPGNPARTQPGMCGCGMPLTLSAMFFGLFCMRLVLVRELRRRP
jgi:hypothetical protein